MSSLAVRDSAPRRPRPRHPLTLEEPVTSEVPAPSAGALHRRIERHLIETRIAAAAEEIVIRIEQRALVVVVSEVAARTVIGRAQIHSHARFRPAVAQTRRARPERSTSHRRPPVRSPSPAPTPRDQMNGATDGIRPEFDGRHPAIDLHPLEPFYRQLGQIHRRTQRPVERHAVQVDRHLPTVRTPNRERGKRPEPPSRAHPHPRLPLHKLRHRGRANPRIGRIDDRHERGIIGRWSRSVPSHSSVAALPPQGWSPDAPGHGLSALPGADIRPPPRSPGGPSARSSLAAEKRPAGRMARDGAANAHGLGPSSRRA